METSPSSVDYEGYPVIKPSGLNESVDAVIVVPCYDKATIRAALLDAGYKGLICGLDELLEQADAPPVGRKLSVGTEGMLNFGLKLSSRGGIAVKM